MNNQFSGNLVMLANISAEYCGLRPFFLTCLIYAMFSSVLFSFLFSFCFSIDPHHGYQRESSFAVVSVISFYSTTAFIGLKLIKQHYNYPFVFFFKIISPIPLLFT